MIATLLLLTFTLVLLRLVTLSQKKHLHSQVLFQLYSPAASSIAFDSDIRLKPSDIRFASLIGEYNATAPRAQYHFCRGKNITPNDARHIAENINSDKARYTKNQVHNNGSRQPKKILSFVSVFSLFSFVSPQITVRFGRGTGCGASLRSGRRKEVGKVG